MGLYHLDYNYLDLDSYIPIIMEKSTFLPINSNGCTWRNGLAVNGDSIRWFHFLYKNWLYCMLCICIVMALFVLIITFFSLLWFLIVIFSIGVENVSFIGNIIEHIMLLRNLLKKNLNWFVVFYYQWMQYWKSFHMISKWIHSFYNKKREREWITLFSNKIL